MQKSNQAANLTRVLLCDVITLLFVMSAAWTAESRKAFSEDLQFKTHIINLESEFVAAAAIDVNRDGKLDVVCGSFWYESPTWTKHHARDVAIIGTRPDGYAHIPADLNKDGLSDLLIINWRSRSIQWAEQPKNSSEKWPLHMVEEPGSMETGRMFDIDNDGNLDILPNGAKFAAWWALDFDSTEKDNITPRFTRQDLPAELAGHGIGAGDINGDGKCDIVGQFGWAEGPANARTDRWYFHPDFDLGRASVPILVVDVDKDGDNDLVYCMAHDYGCYWLEQEKGESGGIQWERHTIDSSFSGGHSPLWADLDGNGRDELIIGKRYLPHEGADPGEYDPLVGYRFEFDPDTRSWYRWTLTNNEGVGFGLDPKVIDLDGDGDLDLLCGGRNGLYWLENLNHVSHNIGLPAVQTQSVAENPKPRSSLRIVTADGHEKAVASKFDAGVLRSQILERARLRFSMMPESHDRVPLNAQHAQTSNGVQDVSFSVSATSRMTARLRFPLDMREPAKAVVLLQGNDAGMAEELVARGLIVLQIDVTDYSATNINYVPNKIWEVIRCIDLLESLPNARRDQIAIIGKGEMAGPLAIAAGAFEPRARVVMAEDFDANRPINGIALEDFAAAVAPRSLGISSASIAPSHWVAIDKLYETTGASDRFQKTATNSPDWLIDQLEKVANQASRRRTN